MVARNRRKKRIIMESDEEESQGEAEIIEINSDEEQQNDDSIWDFPPLPEPKPRRYPKRQRKSRFPSSLLGQEDNSPPPDPITEKVNELFQSDDLLIYPYSGKNAVSLRKRDLQRLEDDELLNDALIDIYPKILEDEFPQANIHTFSSLFYTRLIATNNKRKVTIDHNNVKRWTSNHDIFSKSCLVIPIEQRNHWYLVVVIHPAYYIKPLDDDGKMSDKSNEKEESDIDEMERPYIAILDPLGRRHPSTYRAICEYLKDEAIDKRKVTEDRLVDPILFQGDCPRQTNFSDCGIFCLHFIKQIYQNPEKLMNALIKRRVEAVTDEHWNKEDIPQLRRVLQLLLLKKFDEYELYTKEKTNHRTINL